MAKKNATLGFIFITVLLEIIGFGIIIPIIPSLIDELTNIKVNEAASVGGWLLFTYAIMQFIFSPFLGSLSDKIGRRPVLLISLFGLGIDYLIHAWAPTLFFLFIGRAFAGICGGSITTAYAYIADISSPEKKSQNFGLVGAAFGLGFIIGPAIGGYFGEIDTRLPFLIAAGLSFVNFIYGLFVLPESLPKNKRRPFNVKRANPIGGLANLKKYPVVYGLIFTIFLIHLAGHAIQSNWTFFTVYLFEWKESDIGLSLAFVGLVVGLVQGGLIRVVIPKIGEKRAAFIGMIFWSIGYALFALANQPWMMYAFVIPHALGGIAGPAIQGIVSNQVSEDEQGELQGSIQSVVSITTILGPIIMTQLFTASTNENAALYFPGSPFMLGAVLSILGLILAIPSLKRLSTNKQT